MDSNDETIATETDEAITTSYEDTWQSSHSLYDSEYQASYISMLEVFSLSETLDSIRFKIFSNHCTETTIRKLTEAPGVRVCSLFNDEVCVEIIMSKLGRIARMYSPKSEIAKGLKKFTLSKQQINKIKSDRIKERNGAIGKKNSGRVKSDISFKNVYDLFHEVKGRYDKNRSRKKQRLLKQQQQHECVSEQDIFHQLFGTQN